MTRPILLVGATGLIGRLLADRLLGDGHEVRALARRPTGRDAPGWREDVAPAERWPVLAAEAGADVAVCALGTTIRAAGSEAAFRAVDFDMVVGFARGAREGGAKHLILVSSVGADPGSRAFYLRTKGEVEDAVAALGFDRLDLVRPGLLRGPRADRRLKERAAMLVSPLVDLLLVGGLSRFASIDASTVAAAIATLALVDGAGRHVHHKRDLERLADG